MICTSIMTKNVVSIVLSVVFLTIGLVAYLEYRQGKSTDRNYPIAVMAVWCVVLVMCLLGLMF